jgi:hypothetical protein
MLGNSLSSTHEFVVTLFCSRCCKFPQMFTMAVLGMYVFFECLTLYKQHQ